VYFVFQSATTKEIRKAYHKLSLVLHPDKPTGDEKAFMKVRKGKTIISTAMYEENVKAVRGAI